MKAVDFKKHPDSWKELAYIGRTGDLLGRKIVVTGHYGGNGYDAAWDTITFQYWDDAGTLRESHLPPESVIAIKWDDEISTRR